MTPPFDTLPALVSFALAAAMTPGPNNIMLTASGVNFGFSRTIPHMLGICVGFVALLGAVGLGMGVVFSAFPQLKTALKLIGAAYMLWLAWKVATAAGPGDAVDQPATPLSFWEAVAFQWVNPKGWITAISAMAVYVRPGSLARDVAMVTLVFGLVSIPSVLTWAGFGHVLRSALRDPGKVRVFNIVMALLLVASILPMVMVE